MASTYSTSLKLELIGQGEQSGTWGVTTNNNFGSLVEQAITGVQTISMSNTTYTLSSYNGAIDEARNAVLVLGGTNLAPQQLIAPAVEKLYVITNNSGANVTIKTSGGNGFAVLNNATAQVYCDGTNFYSASGSTNSVVGNFNASGNITSGANITAVNGTISNNLTVGGTLSAGSITGVTGRIVQSVQVVYTGLAYAGEGADTPTGHIATITPTSTSSKILVLLTAAFAQQAGSGNAYLTMVANGRNLVGSGEVCDVANINGGQIYITVPFTFVDSPNTTSALSYQPYINADSGGYAFYNKTQRAILTLLEIL